MADADLEVCVEEQFYLMPPIILLITPDRWLMRLLMVMIAGGSVFRLALVSSRLYLIHQPVAGILHAALIGTRPDVGTLPEIVVTLASLAASIGIAALSWIYFESPLIRIGRQWRYREVR